MLVTVVQMLGHIWLYVYFTGIFRNTFVSTTTYVFIDDIWKHKDLYGTKLRHPDHTTVVEALASRLKYCVLWCYMQ